MFKSKLDKLTEEIIDNNELSKEQKKNKLALLYLGEGFSIDYETNSLIIFKRRKTLDWVNILLLTFFTLVGGVLYILWKKLRYDKVNIEL